MIDCYIFNQNKECLKIHKINKFTTIDSFNIFFEELIDKYQYLDFFKKYKKCKEYIYNTDNYSTINLQRLKLLFSDTTLNIQINHNSIFISEKDSCITNIHSFSYLILINNHPIQILYSKLTDLYISNKETEEHIKDIINGNCNDEIYFVNIFKI